MRISVNSFYIGIIALMVIAISFNALPFWIVLTALIARLAYSNAHTIGVFLLIFGGILGSTIRFEIPFLPIYGLMLNFLGLWLIRDQCQYFKYESASLQMMAIVLIYFFIAYILSPNVNDLRASEKIFGIIFNGILMFLAYYTIVHSNKINNEILTQCLFLTSILFIVHNMNLLGIRPSHFFDYEWHRKGSEIVLKAINNEQLFVKFVNYQVVGMDSLWGISIYLAKSDLNKKKAFVYSLIALQLVLTSGARQAIFGLLIIIMLYFIAFNNKNLQNAKGRSLVIMTLWISIAYAILQILPLLRIDYLSDTLSSGDKGREMLRIMGWNLFLNEPLFGSGIGGFNHAYPGMLYPHNFFVEMLCECGLIGILFLTTMVIVHFRHQRLSIFFLTVNKTFPFLIIAALFIRIMVSGDLTESIGLFSAIFACTITDTENNADEQI